MPIGTIYQPKPSSSDDGVHYQSHVSLEENEAKHLDPPKYGFFAGIALRVRHWFDVTRLHVMQKWHGFCFKIGSFLSKASPESRRCSPGSDGMNHTHGNLLDGNMLLDDSLIDDIIRNAMRRKSLLDNGGLEEEHGTHEGEAHEGEPHDDGPNDDEPKELRADMLAYNDFEWKRQHHKEGHTGSYEHAEGNMGAEDIGPYGPGSDAPKELRANSEDGFVWKKQYIKGPYGPGDNTPHPLCLYDTPFEWARVPVGSGASGGPWNASQGETGSVPCVGYNIVNFRENNEESGFYSNDEPQPLCADASFDEPNSSNTSSIDSGYGSSSGSRSSNSRKRRSGVDSKGSRSSGSGSLGVSSSRPRSYASGSNSGVKAKKDQAVRESSPFDDQRSSGSNRGSGFGSNGSMSPSSSGDSGLDLNGSVHTSSGGSSGFDLNGSVSSSSSGDSGIGTNGLQPLRADVPFKGDPSSGGVEQNQFGPESSLYMTALSDLDDDEGDNGSQDPLKIFNRNLERYLRNRPAPKEYHEGSSGDPGTINPSTYNYAYDSRRDEDHDGNWWVKYVGPVGMGDSSAVINNNTSSTKKNNDEEEHNDKGEDGSSSGPTDYAKKMYENPQGGVWWGWTTVDPFKK